MSSKHEWLNLLEVSGPFLAVPVLREVFPQGLEELDSSRAKRLRSAYEEWRDAVDGDDADGDKLHAAWIDEVLRTALEADDQLLKAGKDVPASLVELPEHDTAIAPEFVFVDPTHAAAVLAPVHVFPPDTDLSASMKFGGLSCSAGDRMALHLRALNVPFGIVTNGERWMLVHAPTGEVATFASWYARIWGQEPTSLRAFTSLLGVRRFFAPAQDRLPALFERSLKHQDEVTDALGDQVRRAIEVLVQALDRADQDRNRELLRDVKPQELYEAGLTVMMRLVFLLAAEERGLLLLGEPRYDSFYAVSTLRMQLRAESDEILERRRASWSRLLAVFRAVFGGIDHPTLRLPAMGGSLFDPDRFPFLEGRLGGTSWRNHRAKPLPIDDRTVLLLLEAIQTFEGRTLSYRALDVEQIGHVYEGLLERTVSRVEDVMLELEAGASAKDASVTLGELDSACVHGKANVTKLLVERSKRSQSVTEKELAAKVEPQQSARLLSACRGDVKLRDRLEPYVRLLRTDPWGYPLVHPKGAFVVVLGADRRKTGTHYTPKSLTERIVEETLTPLVYDGPELGAPRAQWKLKTPEQLLDLKVCDPAMGSGAFLVQACRFLSARLVEAWSLEEAAGRVVDLTGQVHEPRTSVESMPPGVEARAENARRIVAERCLYGVDLNPLAVELAKLSLWLVTLSKGRPFGFLDHNLRSGDSLLGITQLEQLTKLSMTPDTQRQAKLFGTSVRKAVEAAMAIRMQLRDTPVRDIRDVEAMAHLNKDARSEIATVEQLADAFIATVFVADKPRALDSALAALAIDADLAVQGKTDALGAAQRRAARNLSVDAPGGHSRTPFHWPIEFPEAFGRAVHGFDAVLANPPFLDSEAMSRLDPKGRANLARHFTCTKGNWDLYIPFFERALQLAGERGRVSLISPNKWLAAPYGSALRTHTETRLACLLDFSVGRAFEGVGVAAICAVFDTAPRRSAVAVLRATERGGGTSVSREAIVGQKNWGFLLSPHIALLARISSGGTRLGEFVTASDPFTVSEAYQLIDDISEADSTEQPAFRFINTGTVDPYTSLWGERETRYLRRRFMKPVIERAKLEHRFPRRHAQACQPKLILSGMRGFEAFLDERGEFVAGKSSVIVLPRDGRLSLLTCVGLLNSRLIRFYLQEAYGALGVDGGISFSGDIVEALPLPRGFAGRISRVDAAVRSLITTISAGEDASNIIGQVDAAVLDAYGIDAKDRRIIMEGDLIC